MQEYNWIPTVCAPRIFPAKILDGSFNAEGADPVFIPRGNIYNNGWGEIGLLNLTESDRHPVPSVLDITWFSYAENVFYYGRFTLPVDKISRLFEEGFKSPVDAKPVTYEYLIVGTGPRGALALWAAGHGVVTECCLFWAGEKKIDWQRFTEVRELSREELVKKKLAEALTAEEIQKLVDMDYTDRAWNRFHIRYSWLPVFLGNMDPVNAWILYHNGEREFINFKDDPVPGILQRAVPRQMILRWQHASGKPYLAYIDFAAEETVAIFKKLATHDPETIFRIQIEWDSAGNQFRVFLATEVFIFSFQHGSVKLYSE